MVFLISRVIGGSVLMLYRCYIFIIEMFSVVIISSLVSIMLVEILDSNFLLCEEIVIRM